MKTRRRAACSKVRFSVGIDGSDGCDGFDGSDDCDGLDGSGDCDGFGGGGGCDWFDGGDDCGGFGGGDGHSSYTAVGLWLNPANQLICLPLGSL